MNIVQNDWCTIRWTSGGQFHNLPLSPLLPPEMGDTVDEGWSMPRQEERGGRTTRGKILTSTIILHCIISYRLDRVLLDETIRAWTEELIVSWRRTATRSRSIVECENKISIGRKCFFTFYEYWSLFLFSSFFFFFFFSPMHDDRVENLRGELSVAKLSAQYQICT